MFIRLEMLQAQTSGSGAIVLEPCVAGSASSFFVLTTIHQPQRVANIKGGYKVKQWVRTGFEAVELAPLMLHGDTGVKEEEVYDLFTVDGQKRVGTMFIQHGARISLTVTAPKFTGRAYLWPLNGRFADLECIPLNTKAPCSIEVSLPCNVQIVVDDEKLKTHYLTGGVCIPHPNGRKRNGTRFKLPTQQTIPVVDLLGSKGKEVARIVAETVNAIDNDEDFEDLMPLTFLKLEGDGVYARAQAGYTNAKTFKPFIIKTRQLSLPWGALLAYTRRTQDFRAFFVHAFEEIKWSTSSSIGFYLPRTPEKPDLIVNEAHLPWFLGRILSYSVLSHTYYTDKYVTEPDNRTCDTLDVSRVLKGGDCEDFSADAVILFNSFIKLNVERHPELKALQIYAQKFNIGILFATLHNGDGHATAVLWPRPQNAAVEKTLYPIIVDGVTLPHPCVLWPAEAVSPALRFEGWGPLPLKRFFECGSIRATWAAASQNPYKTICYAHIDERDISSLHSTLPQEQRLSRLMFHVFADPDTPKTIGISLPALRNHLSNDLINLPVGSNSVSFGPMRRWLDIIEMYQMPLPQLKWTPGEDKLPTRDGRLPPQARVIYLCEEQARLDETNDKEAKKLNEEMDGLFKRFLFDDVIDGYLVKAREKGLLYDDGNAVIRIVLERN